MKALGAFYRAVPEKTQLDQSVNTVTEERMGPLAEDQQITIKITYYRY